MDASTIVAELFTDAGRCDPYPRYAALHRLGPAAVIDPARTRHGAVVHGYAAVDQVLRDPACLVADDDALSRHDSSWREHPTLAVLTRSMMFANGDRHARMRRLFHQVFTPRRVSASEPVIAGIIDSLLDGMQQAGSDGEPVDFMAAFAFLLPTMVVATVLGVPQRDLAWFRPRVQHINDFLDLAGKTPDVLAAADAATAELSEYYVDLIEARRAEPRDDLISDLVCALDSGDFDLDRDELVSNLLVLFNAGFVTTTNLFGNGLCLLLARTELAATLRADPTRAAGFVTETLRYETPVQFVVRWLAADIDAGGVPIPVGSPTLILIGAANRDPARFERPNAFDPDRDRNQPISFGSGPHYCLGAALARVEGRLAFPAVLRRFPGLALDGAPVANDQLLLRGYRTLLVTLGGQRCAEGGPGT